MLSSPSIKRKAISVLILLFIVIPVIGGQSHSTVTDKINDAFEPAVRFLNDILFWDPLLMLGINIGAGVPFIVVWLIFGGIFFSVRMKFINFRGLRHAINLTLGKYDKPDNKGEVSHFQALATALSATVGLGNIAGVAIAISVGGPGATFWMIMAGILGMTLKFSECTLGLKYRKIDEKGEVSGGPMYYLDFGLRKRKLKILGKSLAVLFAILIVGASFGGGNMLQSNQAFSQLAYIIPSLENYGFLTGVLLAFLVGLVIIGGIKSIARVTEKIVPFMALMYTCSAIVIIILNISEIGNVFRLIVFGAFNPGALKGGFIGVLIMGFRRGSFSNEAGIGSASIAHATARTNEPVSEGFVALLEPFIDTVVICTMTAMVLIFTGFHENPQGLEGAPLTAAAFGSVLNWFPYILLIAVFLFAFSTMISWSYYGLKGFDYLFGDVIFRIFKTRHVSKTFYQLLFLFCIIIGASSQLDNVLDFSDMMILAPAFPNIIGLYILAPELKKDMDLYLNKIKTGIIKKLK
jgi:AGCS family alanine or glycine:cation symporter